MNDKKEDPSDTGYEVARRGEAVEVALWYPRIDGDRVREVEVDLIDVRAADSIRISYDFERDGWSIKQASRFQWEGDDPVCDPDWQEVAFVQAWARQADSVSANESEGK